jgi:hypothetical protein
MDKVWKPGDSECYAPSSNPAESNITVVTHVAVELKARQLFHMTYKLFVASVVLQEMGNIFQSAAYIKYALDGIGFPRTKTLGEH